MITGKTLIAWGYKPGPWFAEAIAAAEKARLSGSDEAAIRAVVDRIAAPSAPPSIALRQAGDLPYHLNVHAEDEHEAENIAAVERHMRELMRLPTIVAGSIMPDACPAGSAPGTIPVGGVVAAKDAIHPGMHSADICCSMAVTIFADAKPTALLDAGMKQSHFGGGGRPRGRQLHPPQEILAQFDANPFLKSVVPAAIEHFATQGDGNHFFYVGRAGLKRPDCARDPSRLTQARGHALQGRHGDGRAVPTFALPGDAQAQRLDSGGNTRRRGLLAGASSHPLRGPRSTTSPSTIWSPRRWVLTARIAFGTSTTSSSARATGSSTMPRERRPRGPILRPTAVV